MLPVCICRAPRLVLALPRALFGIAVAGTLGLNAASLTAWAAAPTDNTTGATDNGATDNGATDNGATDVVASALEAIGKLGKHGAQHAEAMQAWQQLQQADPHELPRLLAAIRSDQPLAANWIRAAAESILERSQQQGRFPREELTRFYGNRDNPPQARRMAYEFLRQQDPQLDATWLDAALDDPSLEMRRDAVAALLQQAADSKTAPEKLLEKALRFARDQDQVQTASENLRKLGQTVDLVRHFGFLTDWQLIGPFDNSNRKGFDQAFAPETDPRTFEPTRQFDDTITFAGLAGPVHWKSYHTDDEYGKVDLNAGLEKRKEVVGYARTIFRSPTEQTVQLRVTTVNAIKAWVGDEPVMSHRIYHSGENFDQYTTTVRLSPGANTILVKLCQNEQTESWTEAWGFQLRVCDPLGTAILSE